MERDELREQFLDAILSDGGQEALVVLVQQRIATGDSASVLVADLSELRPFLSEEKEDDVLDVMDRLVGWCGPSARWASSTDLPIGRADGLRWARPRMQSHWVALIRWYP